MQSVRNRGSFLGRLTLPGGSRPLTGAGRPARGALDAARGGPGSVYDGKPATLEECIRARWSARSCSGGFEEDVAPRRPTSWPRMQGSPTCGVSASYQESERTELDQVVLAPELLPFPSSTPQGNPLIVTDRRGHRLPDVTGATGPGRGRRRSIRPSRVSRSRSNWTVFNGFDRIAERNRAGQANYEASVATLDYQRDVLREDVTNAFYDYIRAQQRVQVALDAEELALQELERRDLLRTRDLDAQRRTAGEGPPPADQARRGARAQR